MKITELLQFDICDTYVKTIKGDISAYRYFPPNISILPQNEIKAYIDKFNMLIDNLQNTPLTICCMDCNENLENNKKFYSSLPPKYEYITADIIKDISRGSSGSVGTQRGFYFLITTKNQVEIERFERIVKESELNVTKLNKSDIIVLLRGFLLRDFCDNTFNLEDIENDISVEYETKPKKRQKKQNRQEFRMTELIKRILPSNLTVKPMHIEQSDFLRQTLMIKNLPMSFETLCFLRAAAQIKDTTMTLHISEMNKGTAVHLINKQLDNTLGNTVHRKGVEQIDASEEHGKMTEFYREFSRNKDKMFYLNVYIECYASDIQELNSRRMNVTAALEKCSYEVLNSDQIAGFTSVCPIGFDKLSMLANNVPGISLAAMFPFSYSTRIDPEGLYLGKTADGGYFFLDLFKNDMNKSNGNICIYGESGYGKSYLLKKIIDQMLIRPNVGAFSFDYENEYSRLFTKLGGISINAVDNKYMLNPLEVRAFRTFRDDIEADETDFAAFTYKNFLAQHLSWLKEFMPYVIPYIKGLELDLLMALINELYFTFDITEKSDFENLQPNDYPTFSDLYEFTQKVIDNKKDYELFRLFPNDNFANILLMLKDLKDGSLAPMFNGHTYLPTATKMNINIQELVLGDNHRTQAYLFNMTTYMWSKIIQRDIHYFFSVDELYLMCDDKYPQAIRFLRSVAKRIRKYNSFLATSTQQLGDVLSPELYTYTAPLFNSPSVKFLFNPGALDAGLYKKLTQMSDSEFSILQSLKAHECLVLVGKNDRYKITVGALPHEKELFGKGGGA